MRLRVGTAMRKILVVEDEIFVATEIEYVIEEMGFTAVGIAPDERSALSLASQTDVALVDLNLQDGPTGIRIGHILAQTHGVTVLFMTANPSQLGDGVPGTLGQGNGVQCFGERADLVHLYEQRVGCVSLDAAL